MKDISADMDQLVELIGNQSETIASLSMKIDRLTRKIEQLETKIGASASSNDKLQVKESPISKTTKKRTTSGAPIEPTVMLSAGTHYVGVDIAEGRYNVSIRRGYGSLEVYDSSNDLVKSEFMDAEPDDDESGCTKCRLELQDGDKIELDIKMKFTYISEIVRRR